MPQARYVIGIDLGTSNCALSYIDTEAEDSASRVFPISHLEDEEAERESPTLPSFLYLPPPGESSRPFLVGRIACNRTATLPGRVIHSAKSWLVNPGVDREEKLLPWASEEIPPHERLSPVEVEARYLEFLREKWDERMEERFDSQDVTITVPASFDDSAQLLTLKAAKLAGFSERVHLLEEPQAAFYYWLEQHSREGSLSRALGELLPRLKEAAQTVLVCDIGGGTTDFSLFEISPPAPRQRLPAIRRIAVSDHILLGGDNIDLALAHRLEVKLGKLSARQWTYLIFLARGLKERVLGAAGPPEEEFHVSVPGEGASLFRASLSACLSRGEAEQLVQEGFFPDVEKHEHPHRGATGLREWGLPFAADSAITRHLAGFLDGREIDAVLFTGGSLKPAFLQSRLLDQIARWQSGRTPVQLANPEMDLAVARGAAYYGAVRQRPQRARAAKIRGGYPHSLYLELYREKGEERPQLVCVLPKGFEAGDKLKIRDLAFKLLLDQPIRFQLYYSNRRENEAGDLIQLEGEDLHPLPTVQTQLTLKPGMPRPPDNQIEIAVEATVSETGLLQIFCVHGQEKWALDFNLRRAHEPETTETSGTSPEVEPKRIESALDRIDLFYGKRRIADLKDTPKNLKRELEKILGKPREEWNIALLRALWPALSPGVGTRVRTPAHEISWLYLAGFCLRPGYGAELDEFRMGELWKCFASGVAFPKNPAALTQWWILWRRVAGGLTGAQQSAIFDLLLPPLQKKTETLPEIVLLAGSLERLDEPRKAALGEALLRHLRDRKSTATEQYLWSLGRLANRVPLYAGAQAAVPASRVTQWIGEIEKIDFRGHLPSNLNLFYSQAARLTGDRNRDLSEELRAEVLWRMERADASGDQKRALVEISSEDLSQQAKIFGESLPAGLKLVSSNVDHPNAA